MNTQPNVGSIKTENTMSNALDQLKQASCNIYEAAGSVGSASAAKAKAHFKDGVEKASALKDKAETAMKERPLVTAGVAFAAGAVLALLFKSRR